MIDVSKSPFNFQENIFNATNRSSGMVIFIGVLFIILGMIGIMWQSLASIISVNILGFLLLAAGIIQLVLAFKNEGWKSIIIQLLVAILYVATGVYTLLYPIPSLEAITLCLAAIFLVSGIIRIVTAFEYKVFSKWFWILLSGIISILMTFLIIKSFPLSSLWLLGLLISLEFVFQGWSLVFLGGFARSLTHNASK